MAAPEPPTEYLTTAKVAERFKILESTLPYWRMNGVNRGPEYVRVGRAVRYRADSVARYEAAIAAAAVAREES